MTNSPTKPVAPLSEEALAEIEARANAASSGPWLVTDGQHMDQYGHHPDGNRLISEGSYDANYHMLSPEDIEFIAHARQDIPALCQSLRAAWAKYDAEDKDHRLTIDTFRQQERIWQQKFDEQEQENAALREQLAQAEAENIELREKIDWEQQP